MARAVVLLLGSLPPTRSFGFRREPAADLWIAEPEASAGPPAPPGRPPRRRLSTQDFYSAAWIQSAARFAAVDALDHVTNLEGATFATVRRPSGGWGGARLTRDYLDFAVEHLSVYWKRCSLAAGACEYTRGHDEALEGLLETYAAATRRRAPPPAGGAAADVRGATVAAIPYYGLRRSAGLARATLRAVVASVDRVAARIVVAVGTDVDEADARRLAASEGFAVVRVDGVRAPGGRREADLLPARTLIGLRDAFRGTGNATAWLGDRAASFRYVYYTESDEVVHARRLGDFRPALDAGHVVVPHRLQGVHDARFDVVEAGENSTCVDAHTYPGPDAGDCGNWWYLCERGARVAAYGLLRLAHGTGITVLRGTENGRRCVADA